MEDSEAEESGTEENEIEENDHFEDCNEMWRITPIPHLKVTNSNYEHPPITSFYNLYEPAISKNTTSRFSASVRERRCW